MHLFGHEVDYDCWFEPHVTGSWAPNRLLGVQLHTMACSAVINSTREAKAICSQNYPQICILHRCRVARRCGWSTWKAKHW